MKNKFQNFYESLIRKQESTESYLYVMDDSQLALNEMPVIDQIKFWSKLNKNSLKIRYPAVIIAAGSFIRTGHIIRGRKKSFLGDARICQKEWYSGHEFKRN